MPTFAKGTIESCGCPHCRKPNDFTDDIEFLEKGNSFKCDHCDRVIWVVKVERLTTVLVSTAEPG